MFPNYEQLLTIRVLVEEKIMQGGDRQANDMRVVVASADFDFGFTVREGNVAHENNVVGKVLNGKIFVSHNDVFWLMLCIGLGHAV